MGNIRCKRIDSILEFARAEYGWDDYFYTFSQNKDWTEPEAIFVCEASPRMGEFLEKYKALGLQYNRYKFGALKSDEPRIYNFEHLENSTSAKERELSVLQREYEWKTVLSFPVYGYGGALGIVGMWSKRDIIPEEMADATVAYLSPKILQFNAWSRELIKNSYMTTYDLTTRELECLRLVAEGRTSKEIARILNIASRTVDFHVQNATDKLGASSRSQAAWRLSLIPSNDRLEKFTTEEASH